MCSGGLLCTNRPTRYFSIFDASFNLPQYIPEPLTAEFTRGEYHTTRADIRSSLCTLALVNAIMGLLIYSTLSAYAVSMETDTNRSGDCGAHLHQYACFDFQFVCTFAIAHAAFIILVALARFVMARSIEAHLNNQFRSRGLSFHWRSKYLRVLKALD
jgi:hypothetical protein